jgi:hypothetical protein
MASKAMISKSSRKGPNAKFTEAPDASPGLASGKGVKVSAKGGAGRIGPDRCVSKRAASNLREGTY